MGSRLNDWRDRLAAYIDDSESRDFKWQSHNCLTFVTGAVTAMTGVDPWKDQRLLISQHRQRSRVIRHMRQYGGNLEGATDRALSYADAVRHKLPVEGDVVLAVIGNRQLLGICLGRLCVFIGKRGLERHRPDRIVAAWGVG